MLEKYRTYKIVDKTHGSYPYWFDCIEEAIEFLAQIIKMENVKSSQYYIREI